MLYFFFSAPISVHNHLLLVLSADNLCKQFGPRDQTRQNVSRESVTFLFNHLSVFVGYLIAVGFLARTELMCRLILAFSARWESVMHLNFFFIQGPFLSNHLLVTFLSIICPFLIGFFIAVGVLATCVDPERFVRGGPNLITSFSFLFFF